MTESLTPTWKAALAPHARARTDRAVLQLLTSLLPYLALTTLMYLTLGTSVLLTALLIVLAAGFLVRTFVIFHDCTHGSLFPSRRANRWVGMVLGLFVLAPFRQWQHEHAVHHATSGDLDRRGVGDVETLTVREYQAKGRGGRLAYRLFRTPAIMFGIGPIVAMMILPRIPVKEARLRQRRSVLLTDLSILAAIVGFGQFLGWGPFLLVWLPAALLAGSAGVWLFYVQHQFEDAYWARGDDWVYAEAALQGSTYLKLPWLLNFFSASIGLHHVHHLNPRVPNYNLARAHQSDPIFATVPTIGIREGLRATRFKLYDEDAGKLVTWAQAREAFARLEPANELTGLRVEPQGAVG
ncbi:fatty acid desaturase [Conexibacter sp. DBS9H8]|uniref:fatty acid desaturase n=1 Tax=Conexibacter sp. DBS9H8 TaxID=2937801 RepID=UPI00200BB7FB|nr:fatty acid desaturase [Conexibacter sp. DBS9H8]